jgi:hypothetical protein
MPELTDDDLHDIADPWHAIAEVGGSMRALAAALAVELLAARAEIAALRIDLDAKASDFDAACHHLGEARERIAELEAQRRPPSLRQYLKAFSDRDEAQSRAAELAERFAELEAERGGLREVAEHRLEVIREMAGQIAADSDRVAQLGAERDAARQVMTDHRCGDQAERAYRRAATAEARVAELEAQQPKPAGYIVGWPEDDGRVNVALDEAELPLEGADTLAYTSIGEAHAFLAEIAPEDPDTQFRVYELREVSGDA